MHFSAGYGKISSVRNFDGYDNINNGTCINGRRSSNNMEYVILVENMICFELFISGILKHF